MSLLALLLSTTVTLAAALPTATINGDLYAATPSGYVLAHCVHEVPSGAQVSRHADGSRTIVQHSSLLQPLLLPKCSPLVDASNPVLRSQDEHNADNEAGEEVAAGAPPSLGQRRLQRPLPADYDGWLQYTVSNTTDMAKGYDGFYGEMSVPDLPKSRPQILYLFPGLQNIDWIPKVDPEPTAKNPFDIIQPVLQYPGTAGGWGVRSWYVTLNAGALMSKELPVAPGDAILCNMTRTGEFGWFVGSTIKSSGKSTNQKVGITHTGAMKRLKTQPWAYNTLECYGCKGCATFPLQPCEFTHLVLTDASGATVPALWRPNVKPAKKAECREATVVHNSSAVTISFV